MTEDKSKSFSKSSFWKSIIRAAEAEPRDVESLRGASGFSHSVVALGTDESRRRVIIVSGEGDARSAAMAQGDIQGTMSSVKVLMVRPVAINLGYTAKLLRERIGRDALNQSDFEWIGQNPKKFSEWFGQFVRGIKGLTVPMQFVRLNVIGVIKDIIQQLSLIETSSTEKGEAEEDFQTKPGFTSFDLRKLAILDPVAADRLMGVCSIPLYDLSGEEIANLITHEDEEEAREILKRHDVLQYFFPAADQLALGLLDREPVSADVIIERLKQTPELGHPFGPLEIVDQNVPLVEVVDALQGRGLLVEGKANFEITPEGRSVRAEVSFKPREGLVSKLLQRFSFKIELSLKDLFK